MRFTTDDEDAYHRRRDELGEAFSEWLATHGADGDPSDAALLMDWKYHYADGALDTWTAPDVDGFLLDWCPRKLSASPQDSAEIPQSVAAFVEFLAHHGLLGQASEAPARIRQHCERVTGRFLREMGDPANFGMAKSLLGEVGGFGAAGGGAEQPPAGFAELLERLRELPPEAIEEALGQLDPDDLAALDEALPPTIGPVRLPDPDARLDAIRDAPDMRRLRLLAQWCPAPGQPLTAKGNLRLADARHLVDTLDTGDDPELGGHRKLTSAAELPHLSELVELALAAGVVRRQKGRLVAVARFAELGEVEAHEKVVRAGVDAGLGGPAGPWFASDPLTAAVDAHLVTLLAELLDAGEEGATVDDLIELAMESAGVGLGPLGGLGPLVVPARVRRQLERLTALGVLTLTDSPEPCPDCAEPHPAAAALTPAGVPIAVDLAADAGFEVVLRPEPACASVAEIVALLGMLEPEEWTADASAWFAAQPDPAAGAAELVGAITAEDADPVVVAAGLSVVEDVLGEHVTDAVRAQLGGPHDGFVVQWLATRSALDPAEIDPLRLTSGMVDVLATILDVGGPEEAVAGLQGSDASHQLRTLSDLWRLDHPRLAEVLEAIGAHHPVKPVAKEARRVLMKYRSRVASR